MMEMVMNLNSLKKIGTWAARNTALLSLGLSLIIVVSLQKAGSALAPALKLARISIVEGKRQLSGATDGNGTATTTAEATNES